MESDTAIISTIRYTPDQNADIYTAISDSSVFKFNAGIFDADIGFRITLENGKPISKMPAQMGEYEKVLSKLVKKIEIRRSSIVAVNREVENIAEKMESTLAIAANLLLKSILSGAPIVVRFHNDADGASGAIALYKVIRHIEGKFGFESNISWRMNRSIEYSAEDFYYDQVFFKGFKSIEKPLVVIIDFGTNKGSEKSIVEAKKSCNIIILDHHIQYEGFESVKPELYINPWDFGGDSNFTAGALVSVFGSLITGLDLSNLIKASFVGDFSTYAEFVPGSEQEKIAAVLDYLTASKRVKNISPSYLLEFIEDKAKLEETYTHAKNLMIEAIDAGLRNVKNYLNNKGISIHIVDFKKISNDDGYPLPGRFSSALQHKFEELYGTNTVTIVHFGNYISIRVSKEISSDIDLLGKISTLSSETNGQVTGGGHKEAASIKTREGEMESTLRWLLRLLGVHV
ncbi:MAG: DHH family phosphoesterase [Candidatus Micrarchaeia archaeon]